MAEQFSMALAFWRVNEYCTSPTGTLERDLCGPAAAVLTAWVVVLFLVVAYCSYRCLRHVKNGRSTTIVQSGDSIELESGTTWTQTGRYGTHPIVFHRDSDGAWVSRDPNHYIRTYGGEHPPRYIQTRWPWMTSISSR
jgi:hypothetical protein